MNTQMTERLCHAFAGFVIAGAALSSSGCEETKRCGGYSFQCPQEWAQWPMRGAAPAQYRFDESQVTDDVTGLMWERKSSGAMYRWSGARTHCDDLDLAGHADWRLPSRLELLTILEYENLGSDGVATPGSTAPRRPGFQNAGIHTVAFPETPPTDFWTESYFEGSEDRYDKRDARDLAWTVSFGTGEVTPQPVELVFPRARCVRTARPPRAVADSTSTRYTITSATVADRTTGLEWRRRGGTAECKTLIAAGTYRAPHLKELMTLIAATKASKPYVDPDAFNAKSFEDELIIAVPIPGAQSGRGYLLDFGDGGRVRLLDGRRPGKQVIPCVRDVKDAPGGDAGVEKEPGVESDAGVQEEP